MVVRHRAGALTAGGLNEQGSFRLNLALDFLLCWLSVSPAASLSWSVPISHWRARPSAYTVLALAPSEDPVPTAPPRDDATGPRTLLHVLLITEPLLHTLSEAGEAWGQA